ncbi:MAG: type IV toxin-antitoxin system AbiEi family antitoxin [Myxococcaceae bacterium]
MRSFCGVAGCSDGSRSPQRNVPRPPGCRGLGKWNDWDQGNIPIYLGGVGGLTLHGLTTQIHGAILDVYVARALKPRELGNARVRFHALRPAAFTYGLTETTIEGRSTRVSDPERTLLDALDYPQALGGMRPALALVSEAQERVDHRKLIAHAVRGSRSSTCQRLGLLLARAGQPPGTGATARTHHREPVAALHGSWGTPPRPRPYDMAGRRERHMKSGPPKITLPSLPAREILADLCREVAANERLQPATVEKDFYLTRLLWALGQCFGETLLLKGGTLLSKVDLGFQRMSENADLVIPAAASRYKRLACARRPPYGRSRFARENREQR